MIRRDHCPRTERHRPDGGRRADRPTPRCYRTGRDGPDQCPITVRHRGSSGRRAGHAMLRFYRTDLAGWPQSVRHGAHAGDPPMTDMTYVVHEYGMIGCRWRQRSMSPSPVNTTHAGRVHKTVCKRLSLWVGVL